MVRDPMLFCNVPLLKPNEMRSSSAARYLDVHDMLSGPLSFDRVLYLEWQRRCAISLGDLVRIRRRWSRGTGAARSNGTPLKMWLG